MWINAGTLALLTLLAQGPSEPRDRDLTQVSAGAWETVALEGLDLRRLAVPFGWLVSEKAGGANANLVFVPDRDYAWRAMTAKGWERLDLGGGAALHRLKTPNGWLVRETLEAGGIARRMTFLPDRRHGWRAPTP